MRIIDIQRNGAPLSVEDAWGFHAATRERGAPRNGPETLRQKVELQRALEDYRGQVLQDFGINLTLLSTPDIFFKPTSRFFEHASGRSRGLEGTREEGRLWYHELEGMRAQELQRHFEFALQGVTLPQQADGKALSATDVGSRSGYFSAWMDHQQHPHGRSMKWQAVDIHDPKERLPLSISPRGGFRQVEAFSDIPKSDIITLNCTMHHVAEGERGQFDDTKIDQFIGTVRDALPPGGLVVMVEDFIGKDREVPAYRTFAKGLDDLFYPTAPGNQKPSREWIEKFERAGFKLEKEEYPIGFNVVGFPVVETLLVFRKTAA